MPTLPPTRPALTARSASAEADAIGAASLVLAATLLTELRAHHAATAAHCLRVARLVARVAPHLPGEPWRGRVAEVYAAAALHDIGKLLLPRTTLTAARALTCAEWTCMTRHPSHGRAVLRQDETALAAASPLLVEAAWGHHEWWDGSGRGYPQRLAGEQIPAIARLVGLCDSYDAMTAEDRPYRAGLTPAGALREIERGAGTQFDPQLVAWVLTQGLLADDESAA